MTDEEFFRLCEGHDWTYQFSDDQSVWRRGVASSDALCLAIKNNPAHINMLQDWSDFHRGEGPRPVLEK